MAFTLAAGQVHDVKAVDELLADVDAQAVIADKAYDADWLIDALEARSIQAAIPPKRNRRAQRDYDKYLYKERNLVERFFNKLKQFRGIATRYDKLAINFMAGVYLAASIILLK